MTAALVVIAIVAVALLVPRIAVPASAAANRRERERDDKVFFEKCMTSSPRWNRVNRAIPSRPRCRICYAPFGGLGAVLGVRPSRQNPNYCDSCFDKTPLGTKWRSASSSPGSASRPSSRPTSIPPMCPHSPAACSAAPPR